LPTPPLLLQNMMFFMPRPLSCCYPLRITFRLNRVKRSAMLIAIRDRKLLSTVKG
jgi:hypothetical protein